ncbi:putative AC transposase, partial [Bienertia sinuspersici]
MINELGKFVIANKLPFSFGESTNYEYFIRVALQPQYRRVPRNTLKCHTQQAYYAYRGNLMNVFRTFDDRVNLNSNTWTSIFGEPFLCVTVNWIDDVWFLQSIICFEAMEESHNGFNIKTRIVNCCKNFNLIDKTFSISLDNATANTKAMDFLKEDPFINMLLGGSLMHVRCCAHILSLCVHEGLGVPSDGLVRRGPLKRTFKLKCDEYGLRRKLLHDAIAYCDVLTKIYNKSRTDGHSFFTNDHWSLAMIIHDVLQIFHNATIIFSYVYEPNIHMIILKYIKIIYSIKQTFETNLGALMKNVLDSVKVKWHIYFNIFPYIYGIAAILDPRVKVERLTSLLYFYYESLGINYDVAYYVNNCKNILERLCELYGAVIQPKSVGSYSKGKSRFGFHGLVLKMQRPDSSISSSSSSLSSSSSSN